MYCKSCGEPNPDGVKFCTNCGKSMAEVGEFLNSHQQSAETVKASAPRRSLLVKPNLPAIIAGALICISVFLPFVKVELFGVAVDGSLMDGTDGVIFLVVAAIGILFAVLGINLAVAITGAVSVVLFLIENSALNDDLYALASQLAIKQSGYYLLLAGCIAMLLAGLVGMVLKKRK